MGDVGLGMKLVLPVDAALNLSDANCFDNCGYAVQKVVLFLLGLDALIEAAGNVREAFLKGLLRAARDFVAHEQTNTVNLLPLSVERKQRADLEKARRYVDRLRKLAPVAQIPDGLPIFVAVVDDEQLTSGEAGLPWQVAPPL